METLDPAAWPLLLMWPPLVFGAEGIARRAPYSIQ